LKGRYHANQATATGLRKGIEYFQQAIDQDPGYALAYGASLTLLCAWRRMDVSFPTDSFPTAKAAALESAANR